MRVADGREGPASSPPSAPPAPATPSSYFDSAGRDDVLSGGVKRIPITTPKGTFKVWTKRVGNNPRIKVLLLHNLYCANGSHMSLYDDQKTYFEGLIKFLKDIDRSRG